MVQLVDSRGFQLSPDLAGDLVGGIQAGQQIRGQFTKQAETESEIARQNQFRQLSGIANDPNRPPQERLAAQQQAMAIDPERQQKLVQQQIATMSARDQQLFQSVVQGAAQINAIPTPEGRLQAAKNRKQQLLRDGITNTTETDMLISALEQGDEAGAQALLDKGIEAGQLAGILEADAGVEIPAEQRAFEALTKDLPEQQKKEATLIKLGLEPRAVGSAIQTISDKGIEEQIGDASATIKQREKFGEMTGSSRAKAIDKGFEQVVRINQGINTIDRAISALEGGAKTGAIERFLPSMRAASVELENIRNQFALDVIGGVTLGAISESELALAKQVGLPEGLDEPELIEHLRERRAAQEKLRNYYQEQINHLDQGGTIASFLREKERQLGREPAQPQTAQQQPAGLPQGVTEEDIVETMKANNMTRQQVLQRLGVQ